MTLTAAIAWLEQAFDFKPQAVHADSVIVNDPWQAGQSAA